MHPPWIRLYAYMLICVHTLAGLDGECSTSHQFQQQSEIEELRQCLLTWYDQNKRDLPWRQLVSEVSAHVSTKLTFSSKFALISNLVVTE